jgi:hypothetical protein
MSSCHRGPSRRVQNTGLRHYAKRRVTLNAVFRRAPRSPRKGCLTAQRNPNEVLKFIQRPKRLGGYYGTGLPTPLPSTSAPSNQVPPKLPVPPLRYAMPVRLFSDAAHACKYHKVSICHRRLRTRSIVYTQTVSVGRIAMTAEPQPLIRPMGGEEVPDIAPGPLDSRHLFHPNGGF